MIEHNEGELVAGSDWRLDEVLEYIQRTKRADVEFDNFGNVCIYVDLHEDDEGNLREGTVSDEVV